MIRFTELTHEADMAAETTLTLSYEERTRSRQRVTLDNGADAGLFIERGRVLNHGDVLCSEEGDTVMIKAAEEKVSTAYGRDSIQLMYACYHLGNRHVALQIGQGWIRYQQDHVLDAMVKQRGLTVVNETAAFAPESGAYQSGVHHHGHSGHGHGHTH